MNVATDERGQGMEEKYNQKFEEKTLNLKFCLLIEFSKEDLETW